MNKQDKQLLNELIQDRQAIEYQAQYQAWREWMYQQNPHFDFNHEDLEA